MYDVLIVGAGPGGIYSAYELLKNKPELLKRDILSKKENVQLMERKSNLVFIVNLVPL